MRPQTLKALRDVVREYWLVIVMLVVMVMCLVAFFCNHSIPSPPHHEKEAQSQFETALVLRASGGTSASRIQENELGTTEGAVVVCFRTDSQSCLGAVDCRDSWESPSLRLT
jgi:hypothetical protein